MRPLPSAELARAYEAMRAQAIGRPAESCPRGLALILDAGLAAWIAACSALASTDVAQVASARATSAFDPQSAELASVLAEMALASRRCTA